MTKHFQKIDIPKIEYKNLTIEPKNINSYRYRNDNNINIYKSALFLSPKYNDRYILKRKLEHESFEQNSNNYKKDLKQKESFTRINSKFKNKNNFLSPKYRYTNELVLKNSSFNIYKNELLHNLSSKNINKKQNGIYYLGGDLSLNHKYFSDLEKNNDKSLNDDKKKDMQIADIKIQQLAKDLNLFQNNNKNFNFKGYDNNLLDNKNILEEDQNNIFPNIYDNTMNLNCGLSSPSRISSSILHSSSSLVKYKNYLNIININDIKPINKNLFSKKINRLKSPLFLSNKFKIKGTNVLSPLCQKARDNFLFKKIFYYFGNKKIPKIMKRCLNNKLNICYAESEKQFEKKIIQINEDNKKKGKSVKHKVGKNEAELRASSIQHKVDFIKKIFDYAYPDIFIRRIKKKSILTKKLIKEKSENNIIKEKNELKEKIRNNDYYKNFLLLKSINIQKI